MSLPSTAAWASPSVMALTSWPSIGWRTWGADGADVNETSTRRQRDVQWHPWWMAVNGIESWFVMGWWVGLQWKTWSSFQSWFLLKISWMTGITWSWAALIRLISLFLGQECSPHRTNRVCQKGTMVRKCRCYMKYIEVWSCLATGEPECIHVSTMKKVGCVFFGSQAVRKTCDIRPGCRCSLYPTEENSKAFSKFRPVALQQLGWLIRGWILMDALTLLCQRFNRWY